MSTNNDTKTDLTDHQSRGFEHRTLRSPGERFTARMVKRSSAETLRGTLIDIELQNIRHALDLLSTDEALIPAAGTIVAARRRFIIGGGRSFSYASLLAWDLSSGLSQVTLIDGTIVRPLDVLCETRPTDVLVVFSFRRYLQETFTIAEQFAAAGGQVIAITDSAEAPVGKIATQNVVVPTVSASHSDSPTAVAAVVHLLSALTTASAKGARRRLAERDRLDEIFASYLKGTDGTPLDNLLVHTGDPK